MIRKIILLVGVLFAAFPVAAQLVVAPSTAECATSVDGSVVLVPNPLTPPVVAAGFSGTLGSGTYYVQIAWYDAAAHVTLPGPEVAVQLSSTGNIQVRPPTSGMPATAVGVRVFIGSTSGSETLQGSVVGSAPYTQNVPLISGTALPTTNNTVCQIIANDAGWPTGTGYTVTLTSPAGETLPGYPMQWQLLGPGNSINLGNGLPLYNGTVTYPVPIMARPYGHGPQSIAGPLSLGNYALTAGAVNSTSVTASSITASNLNNYYYVGGATYPTSSVGIQAALTAASLLGGTVVLPPTGTNAIAMGSSPLIMASNVHLVGAGSQQTILNWTSNLNAIQLPLGTQFASVEGMTLSFSAAVTSASGIRINGSDAQPSQYNIIRDLYISFDPNSLTGGASTNLGIFATSSGPSATDVVLNTFDNIRVQYGNQAVQCGGCEGNFWYAIIAQNMGGAIGATLFQENGLNADEIIDARMEIGTGANYTNEVCLSISGSNNQVKLTCDSGQAGTTALLDTGSYNIFDVDSVGIVTLGTVANTSQYRYVNSANGGSILSVPSIVASGIPAVLTGTGACATITNQVGGTWAGSAKCTGTTGASTLTITPGPTAPHGWTCNVQDETTRANLFQQTSHNTGSCVLTVTSVTANDVFVFSAFEF